ncbi:hypothetical protein ASD37_24930 [Mycobacterium sp. Root135]|uniref:hypothetical protein n=1 Tax=Mycobacterium sp. Root135 TaxID=1736457 RepID=UPI00070238AD|nr:hypothetical protein [Mycobacterium sp. Root135]KQY04055.1 hypothetical protein ASD37_24930 [Mycobacterium sp. Root135]
MSENDATITAPRPTRALVIRHVLERQLGAGHQLGAELVGATTELSTSMAHAPAAVVDEIRSGATLPAALANTGAEVRQVAASTGTRMRSAIGEYVGNQATLPNAAVVGAADVAETVLRAQGTVAATAVDSAFAIATTAVRGGDVTDALSRGRRGIADRTLAARTDVAGAWDRAADEIRGAVTDYDEYLEALSDDD